MDIKQLHYFCTIVEEGTITAAAKQLHMTQPPLTAQIQALEAELNCELFRREGKRIYISEAGRHFYEKAKIILGMCDSTISEISQYNSGQTGTLRLGVVSSVQGSMFSQIISQFDHLYPDVKYDIHNGNTYQFLEMLKSGIIDIAIVRTPFIMSNIDSVILKKESLCAVGLREYFEESCDNNDGTDNCAAPENITKKYISKKTIELKELKDKPLILYRRWEKIIRAHFESIGLTPAIRCTNDSAPMTLSLIMSGIGIGIVPESALMGMNTEKLIAYQITSPELTSEIALICRSEKELSKAARLFWDMKFQNVIKTQTHTESHTFLSL